MKCGNFSFKNKTFFVVSENPSEKEQFTLSPYGALLPIGVDKFSERLNSLEYPQDTEEFCLDALTEAELSEPALDITDNDIWDFLLHGYLNQAHIDYALTAEQPSKYLVVRQDVTFVTKVIVDGASVVIHGDLGNGKSIFLQQVSSYMALNGWRVFWLDDEEADFYSDIEKLCNLEDRALIVVDNYARYSDFITSIAEHNCRNLSLVLCERTHLHEQRRSWLNELIPGILEVPVDIMTDEECKEAALLVQNIGAMDFPAGMPVEERGSLVCRQCERQMSHILIKIFNAPQIKTRIAKAIAPLMDNPTLKDTLFSICFLSAMNLPTTKSLISEVAGNNEIYTADLQLNQGFRELFRPTKEDIGGKSALSLRAMESEARARSPG
jgi:hypothetical protein